MLVVAGTYPLHSVVVVPAVKEGKSSVASELRGSLPPLGATCHSGTAIIAGTYDEDPVAISASGYVATGHCAGNPSPAGGHGYIVDVLYCLERSGRYMSLPNSDA